MVRLSRALDFNKPQQWQQFRQICSSGDERPRPPLILPKWLFAGSVIQEFGAGSSLMRRLYWQGSCALRLSTVIDT